MNHPLYGANWAGSIRFSQIKICNAKEKDQSKYLNADHTHKGPETLSRKSTQSLEKGERRVKGTAHPR